MIQRVHEDTWFVIDHNPSDRVYRVARTKAPFADLGEVERAYGALHRQVADVPPGSRLLLDMREAPPRNDPEFEAAVKRARDRSFSRFGRVAVLVRTAVGKLQVHRMNQDLSASVAVFDDEDRAFDHLLG